MPSPATFIFTAAMAAAAVPSVAVRAEECLSDWGTAGEIVRREKLLTVQQLMQTHAAGVDTQIFKTTLCKDGDDYIYKVVVRLANGQLKTVVVDAKQPQLGVPAAVRETGYPSPPPPPPDTRRLDTRLPDPADRDALARRDRRFEDPEDAVYPDERRIERQRPDLPAGYQPPRGRFDLPPRGGASAFAPLDRPRDR